MSGQECNEIQAGLLGKTVEFLSKNVIQTDTYAEKGVPTSATRSLDFKADGNTVQGGKRYTMLTQNARLINGQLNVSYLPWGEDSGYYIILEPDSGPDIMMTATMDGCSVGYVRADDGAVRVSHHNLMSATDMNSAQRNSLSFAKAALHPSDYSFKKQSENNLVFLNETGFGFVFGVRRNGAWSMYAQRLMSRVQTDARGKTTVVTTNWDITQAEEF